LVIPPFKLEIHLLGQQGESFRCRLQNGGISDPIHNFFSMSVAFSTGCAVFPHRVRKLSNNCGVGGMDVDPAAVIAEKYHRGEFEPALAVV
jgi:hypothetical protein